MPSLWKRDDTSADNGGLGEDLGDGGQYDGGDYDGDGGSWWWSPTGMAIRYTIIILIFASLVLFFLGGYYHAQRRLRKGLPPLPYHAWMVRRRQPRYNYYQQQPHPYYQHPGPQQGYAMHENEPPLPPPPYMAPPPAYAPPVGASKVMADQTFHPVERSGEASLPPLPPAARQ